MDKVTRSAHTNAQNLLLQCRAEAENEWTQKMETLEAKNREPATQTTEIVEENGNLQARNDILTRQLAKQQAQIDNQARTEVKFQILERKYGELERAATPLLAMLGSKD